MSAATRARAPSGMTWEGINWATVRAQVRGLQTRIVKATQGGGHNKAKALQWLLTHSFSGKALAVKRVTENKGRNTPGVDKVTWRTPVDSVSSPKRSGVTGCRKMPLQRLEPCGSKDPCTVLRGPDAGNRVRLPDSGRELESACCRGANRCWNPSRTAYSRQYVNLAPQRTPYGRRSERV